MKISKNVWSEILRFAITVLSSIGAVLGLDSCTNYAPVNSAPVHEAPVTTSNVKANTDIASIDTIVLEPNGDFRVRYLD